MTHTWHDPREGYNNLLELSDEHTHPETQAHTQSYSSKPIHTHRNNSSVWEISGTPCEVLIHISDKRDNSKQSARRSPPHPRTIAAKTRPSPLLHHTGFRGWHDTGSWGTTQCEWDPRVFFACLFQCWNGSSRFRGRQESVGIECSEALMWFSGTASSWWTLSRGPFCWIK